MFFSGDCDWFWTRGAPHCVWFLLEEAGIEMATDEELGADEAYTIDSEATAVKKSPTAQLSASSLKFWVIWKALE